MSGSTDEDRRLAEAEAGTASWRLWGTYLAERQWGTVREDYSASGDAWASFPYAVARSRAYRWGEDGLLGWTDDQGRLCFALALWNGRDDHLKERLFGLSNSQGNHGEDVKELYYYIDATPTGSYAKALYRYPQAAFPYAGLIEENARRGADAPEYELIDTGVLDENRFFDVAIEYAKPDVGAVLIRVTVTNRGPDAASLAVLPTLTFRNTWSWDEQPTEPGETPRLCAVEGEEPAIAAAHDALGSYRLAVIGEPGRPGGTWASLFTENDTNPRIFDRQVVSSGFFKDAFHRYVVEGDASAINPAGQGTKAALLTRLEFAPGASRVLRLRLAPDDDRDAPDCAAFDACVARRIAEADAFYASRLPADLSDDERTVSRQAYAGLLWSKQVYRYDVQRWLEGDPAQPSPPKERSGGRNAAWRHLSCHDVLSMPDGWEYPWFAAWDLAFHAIPLATIDPAFAKSQLLLVLGERYLHPNGAIPAYEFGFGDANPPVHAMAVMKVYEIERRATGKGDVAFLETAFLRLLLNFTWWVNRNDQDGRTCSAAASSASTTSGCSIAIRSSPTARSSSRPTRPPGWASSAPA